MTINDAALKRRARAGHEGDERLHDAFGAEDDDGGDGDADELALGFFMAAAVGAGHVQTGDDERDDQHGRGQNQQRVGEIVEGLNDGLHKSSLRVKGVHKTR